MKYVLAKASKKAEDKEEAKKRKNVPKWDIKKLAVGNWFSSVSYYKVKKINAEDVEMK